jgi:hypothetical protein
MNTPTGTPTSESPAAEIVEEHRQGTPLRPQQPTVIRIVRRSDQQNWRTYRTDCY